MKNNSFLGLILLILGLLWVNSKKPGAGGSGDATTPLQITGRLTSSGATFTIKNNSWNKTPVSSGDRPANLIELRVFANVIVTQFFDGHGYMADVLPGTYNWQICDSDEYPIPDIGKEITVTQKYSKYLSDLGAQVSNTGIVTIVWNYATGNTFKSPNRIPAITDFPISG